MKVLKQEEYFPFSIVAAFDHQAAHKTTMCTELIFLYLCLAERGLDVKCIMNYTLQQFQHS